MARIVVMDAGIGGITQAYELTKALGSDHEVLFVNDVDRFEFTPSNPWVAVGMREAKQIPPRNTNWSSAGKWVHLAKLACEKYFLHEVRPAKTELYYEKLVLQMVGAKRLNGS